MSSTIDFYFDFSSPYGYLASERIEAIAERCQHRLVWHPILLGAVFRVTGQAPLTEAPLKGDYSVHDFARSAREHQVAYQHPQTFPIASVAASRAVLWLREHDDQRLQALTGRMIHALYRAYFTQGLDITDNDVIASIAQTLDLDSQAMMQALSSPAIKDALRHEVEQAIELGVFGSPMMIVDGEPFWGHDRLEQMERWIKTGGW
ncbi:2-hydroxychromene-2-carboxylate isomerase [Granulosicoccus sp. 3-233]|uniref:2-hydroxychromene-2-carboxylate isomerase n=1 Tax=Granulosicoccus sp. 3-233 TaxID=3417969 RepID=UPI003D32C57E